MPGEDWNILTVADGGVVSLLKNLTEDEARGAMQRLMGGEERSPWSDGAIRAQLGGLSHLQGLLRNPLQFSKLECWGPSGAILDVWPKPADYDARWARIKEALAVVEGVNADIGKGASSDGHR